MISVKFRLVFIISLVLVKTATPQSNYKVNISIPKAPNSDFYICYDLGPTTYVKDTIRTNSNGYCEFKTTNNFNGPRFEPRVNEGLYSIVNIEGKKICVFILNKDTEFSITVDNKITINNSFENSSYQEYLTACSVIANKQSGLKNDKNLSQKTLDSLWKITVDDYLLIKNNFIKKNPEFLSSKLEAISQYPDKAKFDDNDKDLAFRKYKNEFIENNLILNDPRVIRSKQFYNNLDYFFSKLCYVNSDSLNAALDFILTSSKSNEIVFRSLIERFIYQLSGDAGILFKQDALYFLSKKYITTGSLTWEDKDFIDAMKYYEEKVGKILIGKVAPDLMAIDEVTNLDYSLHAQNADIIVLYFYNFKNNYIQGLKELRTIAQNNSKKNVKYLTIFVPETMEDQLSFAYKEGPMGTLNLEGDWKLQGEGGSVKMDLFEILSTFKSHADPFLVEELINPEIFILDTDKKILFKNLNLNQLNQLISTR